MVWRNVGQLPSARSGFGGANLAGIFHVAGGRDTLMIQALIPSNSFQSLMLLSLNDQVWTKTMTTSKKFFCGTLCQRLGKYCANLYRPQCNMYQVIKKIASLQQFHDLHISQIRDPCEKVQIRNKLCAARKLADGETDNVKDAEENCFKPNYLEVKRQADRWRDDGRAMEPRSD